MDKKVEEARDGVKMRMRRLMVPMLGVGAMLYLLHILSVLVPVYHHAGGNGGEVVVHLSCIVWCCFSLTCLCGLLVVVGKGKKVVEKQSM